MLKKLVFGALCFAAGAFCETKAVVFDFGGVMTKEPKVNIVTNFLKESLSMEEGEFEKACSEKQSPELTDFEFWKTFADKKGLSIDDAWLEKFRQAFIATANINEDMYALIEGIKTPVAMLSNIPALDAAYLKKIGCYRPFEVCLLSHEIGVEKPDVRAYEILLEKLGLEGDEILFFDDREDNVESARACGIDAVLFESAEQARSALKKRSAL